MPSHRHRRADHRRTGGRRTLGCGEDLRKRSARVPTTRCINGGKRRYFTRSDAELALSGVDHDDPRRREQRCYQCPACHGWHLTSLSLAEYVETRIPQRSHDTPAHPRRIDRGATTASRPARAARVSFDHITAGPAPSPAEVAARARTRAPVRPAPQEKPTTWPGFGALLRAWLRRRLTHPALPAVLRRASKGHRS
ncbi:hypothetical protein [Nocardia higoensis]|uniref:hypothetical protein n=1 Tax=Nocardia higoensis TaxID=228599 RepID=UPI0002DD516C|nr:hypothetical protein [Nocardia higoensis]